MQVYVCDILDNMLLGNGLINPKKQFHLFRSLP
jgi:hypothetical protein